MGAAIDPGLAAVLAQDLRSTLVGLAGVVDRNQRGDVSDPARAQVRGGLIGALELVDQLLEGLDPRHRLPSSTFTPAELVERAVATARRQVQRSAVAIRTDLAETADGRLHGPRRALERILGLVVRALVVRCRSHVLRIAVAVEEQHEDAPEMVVDISGSDIGVDRHLARLVDLVADAAADLGGRVTMADDGAISLRSPLAAGRAEATAEGPDQASLLDHRRVLIVDDDPALREVYRTLFRDLGADCDLAADGADALERCERRTYDLVVMDLNMPRMDGFEAIRRLRSGATAVESDVPVLAITALSDADAVGRSRQVGAEMCLRKPLERGPVIEAVRACLEGQADAAPEDDGAGRSEPDFQPDQLSATVELMGGGADALATLRRLVESYRGDREDMVEQMRRFHRQGDHAELRRVAHTLKSRSVAIGLLAAGKEAAAIERAADTLTPQPDIPERIAAFSQCAERGLDALADHLATMTFRQEREG